MNYLKGFFKRKPFQRAVLQEMIQTVEPAELPYMSGISGRNLRVGFEEERKVYATGSIL